MTDFLFSTPPESLASADLAIFAAFAGFLVLALLSKILQLNQNKTDPITAGLLRRLSRGFFTFGILGGLWAGLRYLSIPYLGVRFVAGLIGLGFLIWLYFFLVYAFFRFPKMRGEWQQESLKRKYLGRSR